MILVKKGSKSGFFGYFLVIFRGPGFEPFLVSFCTVILDKKRSWEDPKMGQKWSKKGCFLAIFSHFWHFLVIHFGDQNLMILVKKGSKSGFFGYFLVIFRGPGFEPFLVSFCTVILDKKRSWEDPKMGQKWSKKGCFLAIFSHFWHFFVIHFAGEKSVFLAKNGEKMVFLKNRFFSTFVGNRALNLEKKVQKSGFFRVFWPVFWRSFLGGWNLLCGYGRILDNCPKKGSKRRSKKGFPKPTLAKNRFLASVYPFWTGFEKKVKKSGFRVVQSQGKHPCSKSPIFWFEKKSTPFLAKIWGPSIPESRMPSLGRFWSFLKFSGRSQKIPKFGKTPVPLYRGFLPKFAIFLKFLEKKSKEYQWFLRGTSRY